MNTNQAQTIAMNEVIGTFRDHLAALESRLASFSGVLMGAGYIIVSNGFALCFDIDPVTRTLSNPLPVGMTGSGFLMLDQANAERIAPTVFDGNGKPAQAMHICDALRQAIKEQRDTIASIEAYSERAAA
jgi:hypothetical protein